MAKKEEKAVKEKNKENKVKKHFFKDFKAELKKVIWPTPKQLVNNTAAVISIVLIVCIIVFVLDFVFEKANEFGVEKLKAIVTSSSTETEESDVEATLDENVVEDANTQAEVSNEAETTVEGTSEETTNTNEESTNTVE